MKKSKDIYESSKKDYKNIEDEEQLKEAKDLKNALDEKYKLHNDVMNAYQEVLKLKKIYLVIYQKIMQRKRCK